MPRQFCRPEWLVRQFHAGSRARDRRAGALLKSRAFVWAVLVLAAALQPATGAPVTVRDAFGRSVTLPSPPQRIVPIFASNTEIVAALGLSDRIVGIEAYTRYPPEVLDRPLVGGRLGFSIDALVALRPDLVVVTPSRQAASLLVDPMERLGIPIIVLLTRSVDEVLANVRLIGVVAGVAQRGDEVAAELQNRLHRVEQRVANLKPPSVVMITGRLGNGLLLVTRPGTYTGDAIVRAGGRLAFDGGLIAQVSPEAIFNSDPDLLLFAGSDKDMRELIGRPGWSDMRSVKTGRALAVSRVELLIPGPRTIDGIEHLAAIFHPMMPSQ
jgi:iron complex transport system substrate-binding protein